MTSRRRRVHLAVGDYVLCGAAEPELLSTDPEARGPPVCRNCQRVLEDLLYETLLPLKILREAVRKEALGSPDKEG